MSPRPGSLAYSSDTLRHQGEALGVQASGGSGCGRSRPSRVGSPGSHQRKAPSGRAPAGPPAKDPATPGSLRPPSHRRTLTFCSSADAASGTSADMVLLLQKRRREGTDYRVARPPAAFCLPSCPPGWRLSPCDDTATRLPPAVAPAAQARQTPAPRPYLPIPAPPALRRPSTSSFPQRLRLAPHLTSVRERTVLPGNCSLSVAWSFLPSLAFPNYSDLPFIYPSACTVICSSSTSA